MEEPKTFRLKRSLPLGYDRQGYIYFTSLAYKSLRKEDKDKIETLCRQAGGDYWRAVFDYVTTKDSATVIMQRHFIASKRTLYQAVNKYYVSFPKRL